MAKYTISVDVAKCIGCGACAATAPELFEMDENNKAKAKVPETDSDLAKAASDACPVQAIIVSESAPAPTEEAKPEEKPAEPAPATEAPAEEKPAQ